MTFNLKNIIRAMLVLLFLVILFHLSIVFKIVPYDITWGGKLTNDTEMYVFETISILIIVFLGLVLSMKGGFIKRRLSSRAINIILWAFMILFILNTIGNIFAETNFEKYFAILTLLFAILIGIILKKKAV
jgi:membrane protease YdiL (CAAX protease family)